MVDTWASDGKGSAVPKALFLPKVMFVEKPLSDKAEEMTAFRSRRLVPQARATRGVGCTTTSWWDHDGSRKDVLTHEIQEE